MPSVGPGWLVRFVAWSPSAAPSFFFSIGFHLSLSFHPVFSFGFQFTPQLVFGFHWLLGSQCVSPSVAFGFSFLLPSYPLVFGHAKWDPCLFSLWIDVCTVPTERHPHFFGFRLSVPPFGYTFSSVHSLGPFSHSRGCFRSLVSFTPQLHPVLSFGFHLPVGYTHAALIDCTVPTDWHPQLFGFPSVVFGFIFG